MSPALVALLFSIGAGTWVYTKLQQRTGYGNSSSAIKGALIVALISFVVVFTTALTIL